MIWWTGLAPWEFEFPFPHHTTQPCASERSTEAALQSCKDSGHSTRHQNVECVRETEILVEQQPPQGVFVCDHAGLVIDKFCQVSRGQEINRTLFNSTAAVKRGWNNLCGSKEVHQRVECTPRPAASLESMDTGHEAISSARASMLALVRLTLGLVIKYI